MNRTRACLQTNTIYTDGESAFLTQDGLGGTWGEGENPVQHLKDEYGAETPVLNTSDRHMNDISEDWDDEDGEDGED